MTEAERAQSIADAVASHPHRRGLRPAFDALWHLRELGVVQSLESYASAAWDMAEANGVRPLVVVMDTPMDYKHPNLAPNVDLARMRDFSVFNEGEFPVPFEDLDAAQQADRQALLPAFQGETGLAAKIGETIGMDVTQGAVADQVQNGSKEARQALLDRVPGAHGTAVAGLVAGTPGSVEVISAAELSETGLASKTEPMELPYAGINPYATIVPISLTAAPYPDMVLGALTYIQALKPNVIVIAAAWADGVDLNGTPPPDDTWPMELNEADAPVADCASDTCIETPPPRDADIWYDVTQAIKDLSKTSVVLCAAGNVDSSGLVYPARLCADSDNNIWAVTACDVNGEELSYAPPLQDPPVRMIKTLSTQLPRADREERVIDPYEYLNPELDADHPAPSFVSPRDIISLDPGGRQGYNPTEYPHPDGDDAGPLVEIGSLYARFSGTSAATAVAGGLASLAISLQNGSTATGALDTETLFDLTQAEEFLARIGMGPGA